MKINYTFKYMRYKLVPFTIYFFYFFICVNSYIYKNITIQKITNDSKKKFNVSNITFLLNFAKQV